MLIITLAIITLLLAVCIYIYSGKINNKNTFEVVSVVALTTFLYLYGAWFLITIYLKYFFVAVTLFRLANKSKNSINKEPTNKVIYIITSISSLLCILYFTGTKKTNHIVHLQMPFKEGKYLVMQGGKGLPTNLFHTSLRSSFFAMDIVKLNDIGNRANKIFSYKLKDYAIYGDTVYSPCDGEIVKTEDNNPDNIPPDRKRGPTNTNQILISTGKNYIFMAHFQPKKVFVKKGDKIHAGQALGLVGNSGFSIEPHLHIQATVNSHKGLKWYEEKGAEIYFNKKRYNLFETIHIQ